VSCRSTLFQPLPESDELVVMGQTQHISEQLKQAGVLYHDPTFLRIAGEILSKLGVQRDSLRPKVCLLRNPLVNAIALYDGTVCINSGLAAKLTHPSQLAFVLAHEATHWQKRHALLRFQSASNTMLMAQITDTLLTPVAARFRLKSLAENGIDFASVARESMYSRELEEEADIGGATSLKQAGYDPQGALDVLKIFSQRGASEAQVGSTLLADHSSNEARRAAVVDHLALSNSSLEDRAPAFDRKFIIKTASVRVTNATWARLSGMFFDALEDLDVVLQAYSDKARDTWWHKAQMRRGETLLAMARDSRYVKASLAEEQWRALYGNASDSEVIGLWCAQAREAFRQAEKHSSRGRRAPVEPQDSVCPA
jgi:hypothetical protein